MAVIGVLGLIGGLIAFMSFVSDRPTRQEVKDELAAQQASSESHWQLIKKDLDYIRDRLDSMGDR